MVEVHCKWESTAVDPSCNDRKVGNLTVVRRSWSALIALGRRSFKGIVANADMGRSPCRGVEMPDVDAVESR